MNAAGDSSENTAAPTAQANSPEPAPESLTPGELLRRERERRSITQLHIAEELHLDVRNVAAIESNRFEELGPPVYARGHLRQYATLVGLSPQSIIERYETLTGRQELPAPIPASVAVGSPVSMERRSLAGPLWSGVALIALALGWWLWATVSTPGDPMQSAIPDHAPETSVVPDVEAMASPPPTETPPPVSSAPQPAPAAPSPATSAATSAAPAAPVSTADQIRMRIEFNDESWTEIYDATGKRLMFGLGESGKVRTLSGTPPLRVTLGNASAVTVQVNDSPIVVPRRAGRDAAKFVIAAGGTIENE